MSLFGGNWGGFGVHSEDQQQGWGSKNFKVIPTLFYDDALCVHYKNVPDEIEQWFYDNNVHFYVEPCYECVKHVFMETEDNRNEYMLVDYKIHFETSNDLMFFKLRWGDNNES